MVRYIVCREGEEEFTPPHIPLLGSMLVEEDKIPVVINYKFDTIIGAATDFQREIKDDIGEISFDITFTEAKYEALFKDQRCYVYASHTVLKPSRDGKRRYISQGTIRCLSFLVTGANPEAFIK